MPSQEPELTPSFSIDPDNPPVAAIRVLLTASFTPEALRPFCKDAPLFRPVVSTHCSRRITIHRLSPL